MSAIAAELLATLPYKPYATDDLKSGCRIFPRDYAVNKRYIQINPPCQIVYLVYDLDYAGAAFAAEDRGLPAPTYTVINPENGHAHIFYRLSAPVTISKHGRMKPRALLEAIQAAYIQRLEADPGYRGPMCKNPASSAWQVINNGSAAYDLKELAEYVDLDTSRKKSSARHDQDIPALGRNVTLFDRLRHWAYVAVREFWKPGQPDLYQRWIQFVLSKARELNNFEDCEFSGQNPKKGSPSNAPLDEGEVAGIARNVARWVWRKFTPDALSVLIEVTHQSEKQAARRAARTAKQRAVREHGLQLLAEGRTTSDVSEICAVSPQTVRRWRREQKEIPATPEGAPTKTKTSAWALLPDIGKVRRVYGTGVFRSAPSADPLATPRGPPDLPEVRHESGKFCRALNSGRLDGILTAYY